MKEFTIGKLANEAGVGVETVRFYERRGLIRRPHRPEKSSFRKYPEDDARKIRFIKRAQELGFTLKEINEIFELNSSPRSTCSDVRDRSERKIREIEDKIRDLKKMKRSLQEFSRTFGESKQPLSQCHILKCFEAGWRCHE